MTARSAATGLLVAFGAYFLLLGAAMTVTPAWFFEYIGPFGELNAHYIRDNGSMALAIGAGCLLALIRPGARAVMLVILTVQSWLHTVSHLIDVDHAHPHPYGPIEFGLLLVASLGLTVVTVLVLRTREELA